MNLAQERREDRELRQSYQTMTLEELALDTGYSKKTLAAKIRRAGGEIRKGGVQPQRYDQSKALRLAEEVEAGERTVNSLADELGVSVPTARRIVRELGFRTPRQR